ncbi:heavy-metal-associated domain-containing protein [Flagellimonas sp. CMM7]|uniref:heavy-metal-associated domain-containing protein n=1 Tax=Flagellimonas sp. CMM7 TaxID=2654676 RepID=UPI0013D34BF3|nr:heavy-metal-associated domain-containing protein [Flagellimonas sp. CMM7]UII79924.1 heavy-metal-associated domain-containing protein [Flagellimonas sp. CMM7]
MRKSILVFFLILGASLSHAQDKNKTVTFEVKGNCGMCKSRIEKTAIKIAGVKFALWNVDTKEFKAIIDERKCSIDMVKKKIAGIGHDIKGYIAPLDVYNNLPACCQYRNPESIHMNHEKH